MVVAYCSFCPKMPQKASKRGLLAQKSGGLLEFQSSGGLIKSGLLFAIQVDSNLWTLLCIDPHESQTVFYYCNTAETVYDGTVELLFTFVYPHSG